MEPKLTTEQMLNKLEEINDLLKDVGTEDATTLLDMTARLRGLKLN